MSRLIASSWQHGGLVDRCLRASPPYLIPTVLTGRAGKGKHDRWRIDRDLLDLVVRERRGELTDPLQGRRQAQRSYAERVVEGIWIATIMVGLFYGLAVGLAAFLGRHTP